jgi:hypothetical protein
MQDERKIARVLTEVDRVRAELPREGERSLETVRGQE